MRKNLFKSAKILFDHSLANIEHLTWFLLPSASEAAHYSCRLQSLRAPFFRATYVLSEISICNSGPFVELREHFLN